MRDRSGPGVCRLPELGSRRAEPEATVERLSELEIVVRSLPGLEAIRASVHAFNTREDVDALLEGL
ncbi:class V aminotransferase [Natronorubrum tibetense GA33]|uniref:Class V aminotransferase n=1 Tax=Natronorubrum tibetense GA33 TaxID=1114856 RepID=L9VV42_9EURY|nr:class V aminotransferase [Natronorubrum tibetense GA33]